MSVIYDTNQFAFVCHKKYIDEIFNNVYDSVESKKKSYKIKKELFRIIKPYRTKEDVKKKRGGGTSVIHEEYKRFIFEVNRVKELFCRFRTEYLSDVTVKESDKEEPSASTNLEAIQTSNEVYNKSDSNILTNTFGGNKDENAIVVNINDANYLIPSNCNFYCYNVTEMDKLLNGNMYDVILLDPPWWNKFIRRKRFKTGHGYKMLYNAELKELPIEKLIKPINGLVVVWCTNSPQHYLYLTKEIFPKWNVKYIGKWYWLKVTKSLEPICTFSDPPGKQPFEQIIFASTNGSSVVVNEKLIVSVPSAIHSHKPPLSELLKPLLSENNAKCLEIFARYLLPNWTSYGLEAIKLQHESLFLEVV